MDDNRMREYGNNIIVVSVPESARFYTVSVPDLARPTSARWITPLFSFFPSLYRVILRTYRILIILFYYLVIFFSHQLKSLKNNFLNNNDIMNFALFAIG